MRRVMILFLVTGLSFSVYEVSVARPDVAEKEEGFQWLFNGKDMTGWRVVSGKEWSVEDGALVGPVDTPGWIATQEEFDNFILRLQYWVSKNDTHESNSGIFFRAGLEGAPWVNGYECQISLQDENNPTGSIYNRVPTKLDRMRKIAPEKQWNDVEIYAYGPHINVRINGEPVQDCTLHVRDTGVIGLQMHHPGVTIKYRNIRIKRLTEMPEEERGWRPIFNGKDLTGWTVRGKAKWEVKDGVLIGTGGMGHIYYTAETFDNLEMRAMIRINKDGNSGFYFRCRPPENNPDGWPVGYECQVDNHDPRNYTGAIYGKRNVKELITRDEAWFSERVRAEGDHIQTWVNGMLQVDFHDGQFKEGYIACQGHDPSIVVEYRDIMVRPIK